MTFSLPRHIAVVMDGNGRWAQNRGLPRFEGHKAGVESVKSIIQHCLKYRISCLSLFAFSSENWSRPTEEVHFLMELFLDSLRKEVEELHRNGIRLRFTGDREPFSMALKDQMQEAEAVTSGNESLVLNIVVNYGGKWDIVNAAKRIAADVLKGSIGVDQVNESVFVTYLNTRDLPDPDLFIRTSGEIRISNFYLWQLAYTELYFTDVLWPDFDENEFERALAAFQKRNRRFGDINSLDKG